MLSFARKKSLFLILLWLLLIQQFSTNQDFWRFKAQFKNLIDFRYLLYILFWNCLANPETWNTLRLVQALPITQETKFARNLDFMLTIVLKYSFSWRWKFNVQKSFILAFGSWIYEFTKNQSGVRFNIQVCHLKLRFSFEIYFSEGDVDHEPDFCDRFRNERN